MQSLEDVRAAFQRLADRHDEASWCPEQGNFDRRVRARLVSIADGRSGEALFLGAGSAPEAVPFVAAGWRCDLVDIAPRMLELARHRHQSEQLRYVCASADDYLQSGVSRYRFISLVGEVIGYVPSPIELLARATARLADDGSLALTWVDATALRACDTTLENGAIWFAEQPDLDIRAFRPMPLRATIASCGLRVVGWISVADSPRRFWHLRKAYPHG